MVSSLAIVTVKLKVPAAVGVMLKMKGEELAAAIEEAGCEVTVTLQLFSAPITTGVALGVKVGVLMGSAYLFTREIVDSGAVVPGFRRLDERCAKLRSNVSN